jgi:hypothetical protein
MVGFAAKLVDLLGPAIPELAPSESYLSKTAKTGIFVLYDRKY